ncbi:testis-specific protein TEX28 [Sarcophilus harrisii]|uniref:Testis expressed 28 n=1 Tax=Sarcophilus harrisii TaxID=9305 RepID=G3W5V1_SARHA|nr:testis-specific protein TEX28 [Sarcophilus harrisii]
MQIDKLNPENVRTIKPRRANKGLAYDPHASSIITAMQKQKPLQRISEAKYMKSQSSPHPSTRPFIQERSSTHKEGPPAKSGQSVNEIKRNLQDSVKHRILYLSEQLKVEKTSRDENTVGYLKLVSKADRHQATHIRQAFEKVNQRSSATIAHIERKLRQYHQQLQEMEEGHRPKSLFLKDERANRNQELLGRGFLMEHERFRADEYHPTNLLYTLEEDMLAAAFLPEKSFKRENLIGNPSQIVLKIKEQLDDIKKSHSRIELSYQALKEKYMSDLKLIVKSLQEEKYRQKAIEEQVNDHMQGHLGEISHIKQNLACTEEKMVYLSYERAKEIWEVMETFQNRISKLEIQQQAVQLQIIEKSRRHPHIFLAKFMNLLLTLTTIVLVCVSTVCTCSLPFLKCRLRTCTILLLIGLGMATWKKCYSVSYVYWHEWILSRWKLYYRDLWPLPRRT